MIRFTDSQELQKKFFYDIKGSIPDHVNLVDEIAEFLNISNDSAYRRIRGDKQLNFHELFSLSQKYGISLDTYLEVSMETIPFEHFKVHEKSLNMHSYLGLLLERAKAINNATQANMVIIANDLVMFQLLQYPELAAFKIFFWQKSSFGFDSLKDKKFNLDAVGTDLIKLSESIVTEYCTVSTVEIVGIDAIRNFLRQIRYYLDLGFFENPNDALRLCDSILKLVQHIRLQAELGFKFPHNGKREGISGTFTMYYNELFVIDGIALIQIDEKRHTYIGTGPLNFIQTHNIEFYNQKLAWANNLMTKSILLSGVSEKARQQYFKNIEKSVRRFKEEIQKELE